MNKLLVISICAFFILNQTVIAQTPLWQGKGRIAISSDGNEHDHDDWAATPLSLALIAAEGLQNKLVLYTYSDHIWGSNIDHPAKEGKLSAYQQMNESALGGKKWFGFKKSKFICAVDNPEVAYNALRDEINKSTAENPLIIVAAGPMQVEGEAINRSMPEKRQYVTVLSHSKWNNMHSDKPSANEPPHSGWTFDKMIASFENKEGGSVKFVQILDQNNGPDYVGLFCEKERYDWIKNSEARNNKLYKKGAWDWLYSREETCIKKGGKNFDPSDAGMILYLFTGIEKTNPDMAKAIMEHPVPTKK